MSNRDGNYEIYAMLSAGGNRITNNAAEDTDPTWAPGSDIYSWRITYSSRRDGNAELYTTARRAGFPETVTRLTNNTLDDQQPAWMVDGSRLVFATLRDGKAEVYSMLPDGSDPVRLTNNTSHDNSPSFSACTPY